MLYQKIPWEIKWIQTLARPDRTSLCSETLEPAYHNHRTHSVRGKLSVSLAHVCWEFILLTNLLCDVEGMWSDRDLCIWEKLS
jgi:hypothetical protein